MSEPMSDNNTTEFIRRRIRNWRTTLAGVAMLLCPLIAIIWPEYAVQALLVATALGGAGHIAGADGKNIPPPNP
jgi:hypothetical protein